MFYRFIKKMSPFIILDCKLGRWKLNDNINRRAPYIFPFLASYWKTLAADAL